MSFVIGAPTFAIVPVRLERCLPLALFAIGAPFAIGAMRRALCHGRGALPRGTALGRACMRHPGTAAGRTLHGGCCLSGMLFCLYAVYCFRTAPHPQGGHAEPCSIKHKHALSAINWRTVPLLVCHSLLGASTPADLFVIQEPWFSNLIVPMQSLYAYTHADMCLSM